MAPSIYRKGLLESGGDKSVQSYSSHPVLTQLSMEAESDEGQTGVDVMGLQDVDCSLWNKQISNICAAYSSLHREQGKRQVIGMSIHKIPNLGESGRSAGIYGGVSG
jgi:hypothetical protein